ncbi:prepilin peptidase [Lactobacillus sp. YT155]|uniref:prepilin peptidase n=1 Tax=Lactobacillus sp. YT155 TaxID=3060955 RepID=UPI00265DD873|nr:A24 family peptidase [Lactobacillus sp. YT155]MDO1604563.1 prepilin peptidase [Lactobacillus sp. YT155]
MFILYVFLIFILSACCCSFLNLVAMRLPKNESIVSPRSHCDYCSTQLKWFELIPILGYAINRTRCRYCNLRISLYFPLTELVFGLSTTYIYFTQELVVEKIVLLSLLLFFACMDYCYQVVMPFFFAPALLLMFYYPFSIAHFAIFFVCLFSFSRLTHGLGMGDVEVLSFLALFLPIISCLWIIVLASFLCLVLELCYKVRFKKISFVPYIYFATVLVTILE